jgi:hypothetical protein
MPASNGDARSASAGTKHLTLIPGLGYKPGLKGVPQVQRAAKPFSPDLGYKPGLKGVSQAQRAVKPISSDLGYEPGRLGPNKSGPICSVRLDAYGATWSGLWSRLGHGRNQRCLTKNLFSTSVCRWNVSRLPLI